MKRARFTEEQIIEFLREQECGMTTAEVCRRHGLSEATFYKWEVEVRRSACENTTTITRQQVEARVLAGLKDRLLSSHLEVASQPDALWQSAIVQGFEVCPAPARLI